jgi:hypothetical protein
MTTQSVAIVEDISCQHCVWMSNRGVFHAKNCNCGHHHSKHNFCGGCTVKGCKCDCYDQSPVRVHAPKEHVDKDKTSNLIEFAVADIDIEELEEQVDSGPSELVLAQERIAKLRDKVSALNSTAECPPD